MDVDSVTVLELRIRIWCRASGTKAKELVIHPREGIAGDSPTLREGLATKLTAIKSC